MCERCDELEAELAEAREHFARELALVRQRLVALEEPDDDGGTPRDLEAMVPVERWVAGRSAGENLSANVERATYVWEAFEQHAVEQYGNMVLSKAQVENILTRDPDGPQMDELNRNTRVRVMKLVASGSGDADEPDADGNLIRLKKREGGLSLVADVDEWRAHHDPDDPVSPEVGQGEDVESLADDADAELERLAEARTEPVLSGGEHVTSS